MVNLLIILSVARIQADLSSSAKDKGITDAIVELVFAYDTSIFVIIQRLEYGNK